MIVTLLILVFICVVPDRGQPIPAMLPSTTLPATATPEITILNELENLYQPVPFAHRSHAQMAQMWDGCQTCHHRGSINFLVGSGFAAPASPMPLNVVIRRCKDCHSLGRAEADIHRPGLKAAYHRQCLGCHRDWMGENACLVCHAARDGEVEAAPTADDIAGRMHPPMEAPREKLLKARFTPVAGRNVLFRHEEHVKRFGLQCSQCHRRDTCADCHVPNGPTSNRPQPIRFGRTWRDTHAPCADCHVDDRCTHCHYPDGQLAPPQFDHARVGQTMDRDHENLACRDCHKRYKGPPSCDQVNCHVERQVEFPFDRPGPRIETRAPAELSTALIPATQRSNLPTTRPTMIRIRRGGT